MSEEIKEDVTELVEEYSVDDYMLNLYDKEKIIAREEGSKSKTIEIAKNLLNNNIDIEIISNSTGLSYEELEKL